MQPTTPDLGPPKSIFSFYGPALGQYGDTKCYFTGRTFDQMIQEGCNLIAKLKKLDGPNRIVYADGNVVAQMVHEGQFVGREFKTITYYDYKGFTTVYNLAFRQKVYLLTFVAYQALGISDYKSAQFHLLRAVGCYPYDPIALRMVADMHVRGEVTDSGLPSASCCFQRLYGLCPDDPYVLLRSGEVALFEEKYSDAHAFFQKAVELAPDWSLAHARLGAFLTEDPLFEEDGVTKETRLQRAAKHLATAIQLDSKNDFAFAALGSLIYQQEGAAFTEAYKPAEYYLTLALEANPKNGLALKLKAAIEVQPEMDEVIGAMEEMLIDEYNVSLKELENSELTNQEKKELTAAWIAAGNIQYDCEQILEYWAPPADLPQDADPEVWEEDAVDPSQAVQKEDQGVEEVDEEAADSEDFSSEETSGSSVVGSCVIA